MKQFFSVVLIITAAFSMPSGICSQEKYPAPGLISAADLEAHVSFLASPLLTGRKNGSPGLDIAQEYIVSNARLLKLKPAGGTSYLQPYPVIRKGMDREKTEIRISSQNGDTVRIKKNLYQVFPSAPTDISIEGEVVFAGYGLVREEHGYNDFEGITTEDKILLVMAGAPTSADGSTYMFEGDNWSDFRSYTAKLSDLFRLRAKAILFICDPKSGFDNLEEQEPGIADYLNSSISLKGKSSPVFAFPGTMKIFFADRSVADRLLEGSGKNLEAIQEKIDSDLKPYSFAIPGKNITINIVTTTEELTLNNVAAVIEGSDPVLKNEFLVYSCHADHIGGYGDWINTGADDNATGCAALLSIAAAFRKPGTKPLRSILFLWFSGEEIGLLGSEYYVDNPLVPLENTVADINVDMIGRVKGIADTTSDNPMTGLNEVFVITGNQSRELSAIARDVDERIPLDFNYSLSGRTHPLQLFARSDHYNFVRKDIPVLFFTTGLHTDYHTPGDVIEKINFDKMEKITEALFQIGYTVTNNKKRLKVNNPFSRW
ncbi:MAG: M28 family peptidase [Bacteroidales bacterium]|nr:M28 family peptidase [Bacteroidales bacterium]